VNFLFFFCCLISVIIETAVKILGSCHFKSCKDPIYWYACISFVNCLRSLKTFPTVFTRIFYVYLSTQEQKDAEENSVHYRALYSMKGGFLCARFGCVCRTENSAWVFLCLNGLKSYYNAHKGIDKRMRNFYFISIRFLTLSIWFQNWNRFSIPNPNEGQTEFRVIYLF